MSRESEDILEIIMLLVILLGTITLWAHWS